MDGVVGLACGEDAGDVGLLVEVDPEAAHGVVHAGEDLHGDFAGVVADELLVDFEDAFELALQRVAVDVGRRRGRPWAGRRCPCRARRRP